MDAEQGVESDERDYTSLRIVGIKSIPEWIGLGCLMYEDTISRAVEGVIFIKEPQFPTEVGFLPLNNLI